MEAAPEVVVKSERSPSSKRVRRTARKSTNGWKPEQCIYARDHNGDLFFNRSATLEQVREPSRAQVLSSNTGAPIAEVDTTALRRGTRCHLPDELDFPSQGLPPC